MPSAKQLTKSGGQPSVLFQILLHELASVVGALGKISKNPKTQKILANIAKAIDGIDLE